MTIVDFSRVKDSQLSAYVQSLESAQGLQAIGATSAELSQLPPDNLADRLKEAKAELQERAIVPEPPPPAPNVFNGWAYVKGYPRPSTTAKGTFDVRIEKGGSVLEFLSLSDGGDEHPLVWAAQQAAAYDEASFKIADLNDATQGEPYVWPEEVRKREKLGEFADDAEPAEVAEEAGGLEEVRRGN